MRHRVIIDNFESGRRLLGQGLDLPVQDVLPADYRRAVYLDDAGRVQCSSELAAWVKVTFEDLYTQAPAVACRALITNAPLRALTRLLATLHEQGWKEATGSPAFMDVVRSDPDRCVELGVVPHRHDASLPEWARGQEVLEATFSAGDGTPLGYCAVGLLFHRFGWVEAATHLHDALHAIGVEDDGNDTL
jgi:hypothetical protein